MWSISLRLSSQGQQPGLRGFTRANLLADLHRGMLVKLKDFLIELVFFHRGLNSLVAFELKVGRFEPEYLGKLSFYLEALDRDVRKPHERPSIGVLLCASKDNEVVEYALSRTLVPRSLPNTRHSCPIKNCFRPNFMSSIFRMPSSSHDSSTDQVWVDPRVQVFYICT